MASPFTAAIATHWIQNGTAAAMLEALRGETRSRQALAAALLPPALIQAAPEAFHLWLTLPPPWTRGAFIASLRAEGAGVVSSDMFALENPPEAVRLGLGAATSRAALQTSLQEIAELLHTQPELAAAIV
jgi:DNA-binding transcriptional MocR family regulator